MPGGQSTDASLRCEARCDLQKDSLDSAKAYTASPAVPAAIQVSHVMSLHGLADAPLLRGGRRAAVAGPGAGALARRALQLRVIFIELILPATPPRPGKPGVVVCVVVQPGRGARRGDTRRVVSGVQAAGRVLRILAAALCNVQRRLQINNIRQHAGMRPRAPYSRTADSTQHHWCTASLASAFSEPQPGPSLNAGLSIGQKGHVGRNDLVAICHRLCQT